MEQRMCPVDVISVCSAGGEITPLRLQLIDEEKQMLRINIEQILSVEDIDHVGVEAKLFRCRATVWGKRWTFDLKYYIRSHSWRVQRMI